MTKETTESAPAVPYVPVQRVDAHTYAPNVQKTVADTMKALHRNLQNAMENLMKKRGSTEITMEDFEKARAQLLHDARIDRRIIQGILGWWKKP